ncbi:MAG: STAS/SEC14 domain-containing protein [Chakrabartia sp.]
MLNVDLDPEAGFLELTVDGAIDDLDYQAAVDAVNLLLTQHQQINVVEVVKTLGWVDPSVWFKDLYFHLTHRNFMRRAAIVSDKGWVGPLTSLIAPLYPTMIRSFTLAELDDARAWVRARDEAPSAGAAPPADSA